MKHTHPLAAVGQLHLQHVAQELRQLEPSGGERLRLSLERVSFEERRVMALHHPGAGAGGDDTCCLARIAFNTSPGFEI